MPLARLIYTSRASLRMGREEVESIAAKARDKNRPLDVTGVLLFGGGRFLQILEGDVFVIASLYDRIKDDPRHTNCEQLAIYPIRVRLFKDWRMALVNLELVPGMERRPLQLAARLSEALDGIELEKVIAVMIREFVRQCGGKKPVGGAAGRRVA